MPAAKGGKGGGEGGRVGEPGVGSPICNNTFQVNKTLFSSCLPAPSCGAGTSAGPPFACVIRKGCVNFELHGGGKLKSSGGLNYGKWVQKYPKMPPKIVQNTQIFNKKRKNTQFFGKMRKK